MTSLAIYRTRLSEDYTRDPNYRVWNQSTVERAINKGYNHVQEDLGRTMTTAENNKTAPTKEQQELYELPSGFVRMKLIRYNGDDLVLTTRKQVKMRNDTTQSGTPSHYYIYSGYLGLYPVPDAVGTIDLEYYEQQSTLSDSQDSTLPAICDDAILLYSAYKLFLGVRDQASASMFLQDYAEEINKVRTTLRMNDENIRFGYEYADNSLRSDVLDINYY